MKTTLATLALALLGAGSALAAPFQILVYESPADLALRSDAAAAGQAYWQAYQAYGAALQTAGVLRGGAALHGSAAALHGSAAARAVRVNAGQTEVAREPVARSATELGGYFVIEVDSLDDAVAWAARAPAALRGGAAEVRPLYPVPGMSAAR